MKTGQFHTQLRFACASILCIPHFIGPSILGLASLFELEALGRHVTDDAAPQRLDKREFAMPTALSEGLSLSASSHGQTQGFHPKQTNQRIHKLPEVEESPQKNHEFSQKETLVTDEDARAAGEALLELGRSDQTSEIEKRFRKRPLDVSTLEIGSSSFQGKVDLPLKKPCCAHDGRSDQSQSYLRKDNLGQVSGCPEGDCREFKKLTRDSCTKPLLESVGQHHGLRKEDAMRDHVGKSSQSSCNDVLAHCHFDLNQPNDDSITGTWPSWSHDYLNQAGNHVVDLPASVLPTGYAPGQLTIQIDSESNNEGRHLEVPFKTANPKGINSTDPLTELESTGKGNRSETSDIQVSPDQFEMKLQGEFSNTHQKHLRPRKSRWNQNSFASLAGEKLETKLLKIDCEHNFYQLEQIKMISIEEHDPKLLAWIASMPYQILGHEAYLVQEIKNEFHDAIIQHEQSKIQWVFPGIQNNKFTLFNHILDVMDQILEQIWILNGQFIDRFKIDGSGFNYLQERIAAQNWTCNMLMSSVYGYSLSSVSDKDEERAKILDHHQLNGLIYNLLHYQDDGFYWEVKTNYRGKPHRYGRCTIYRTELAIRLIGSYYKTTNEEKWTTLFNLDKYFYLLLAQIRWKKYNHDLHHFERINHPEGTQFFPWGNDWPEISSSFSYMKDYSFSLEKMMSNVVEISESVSSSTSIEKRKMINPISNTFDWLVLNERDVYPMDYSVLDTTFEKICENLNTSKLTTFIYQRLTSLMKEFSKMIWIMNFRILRAMGTEITSDVFTQEQKNLQEWFQEQALIHARSFETDTFYEINSKYNSGDTSHFKGLLIYLCKSGENPTFQKFLRGSHHCLESERIVNPVRADMTKATVEMINSYYQQTNFKKWRSVFLNDESFLYFVVNTYRIISANNFSDFCKRRTKILKNIDIIPWKEKVCLSSYSAQESLRKAFGLSLRADETN